MAMQLHPSPSLALAEVLPRSYSLPSGKVSTDLFDIYKAGISPASSPSSPKATERTLLPESFNAGFDSHDAPIENEAQIQEVNFNSVAVSVVSSNAVEKVATVGGIVADEVSMDSSSSSIPSSTIVNLRGKDVSQISFPLPPRKTKQPCSIDQLIAKVQLMKSGSTVQQDYVQLGSLAKDSVSEAAQNKGTEVTGNYLPYVLVKGSMESPRCSSALTAAGKKTHGSNPEPYTSNHTYLYLDKTNDRELLTHKSTFQPATRQTPAPNVSNLVHFPPKPTNDQFNPHFSNIILASHLEIPRNGSNQPTENQASTSNFPPLPTKSNLTTVPVPHKPKLEPANPTSSWSQLFKSNRIKANGTSLEHIPPALGSPDCTPRVVVTREEISDELDRWKTALVGYVIGANRHISL